MGDGKGYELVVMGFNEEDKEGQRSAKETEKEITEN